MTRLLLLSLLSAMTFCCRQPQSHLSASQAEIDTLSRYMDFYLADLLNTRQYHRAGQLLDSLRPRLDRLGDVNLNMLWMDTKATQLMGLKNYDSARLVIMEEMKYALQEDTSRRLYMSAEAKYGYWLMERDSLRSAIRYLEDAFYLAKKLDSVQLPVFCYDLMRIYLQVKDYTAMRRYLDEGWRLSRTGAYDSTAFYSMFATAFMAYYTEIGQLDSAILFYNIALKDTTSYLQSYYRGVLDWNMGEVLVKKNAYLDALPKLSSGFAAINQYDGQQPALYVTMANTHLHLEKYTEASLYADTAIAVARQQKDWETATAAWQIKASMYGKLGRYQQAWIAADSALMSLRTQMDSSIAKHAQQVQTQYQVKAKDDRIQALATLNEANRKISRQQRILLLSLAATTVSVGIIALMWYRRRRLKNELREAALRQQLLRTQMEPHFIFNTLSVLQGYIYENDVERATAYLNRFSKLLQLSLHNARQPFVSVDTELAALEEYLYLHVMHAETPFSYSITLDPQLQEKEVYIPPMLLQPFVENAIMHGFSDLSQQGQLDIRIDMKEHQLLCIIEDNGKGLRTVTAGKLKNKPSYSTAITHERLQILSRQSGKPATLVISERNVDGTAGGTRVEILIPYRLAPVKDPVDTDLMRK